MHYQHVPILWMRRTVFLSSLYLLPDCKTHITGGIIMIKKKRLTLLSFSAILFFAGCNINLKPNAVEVNKYLSKKINTADIYDNNNPEKRFVRPFNFGHTDFGRLILVNIDKHPTIKTVELVVQKDKKGAFVVVYYHNGKVENYINPHVSLNKKYLKPNSDWEIAGTQDFAFSFDDTKQGLSFTLDFKTRKNEHIRIKLKTNQINLKHYSFLAAIGADLSEVKRFPFIYLKKAGFIPVENTEVEFKINNKLMQVSKVPVRVEGKKSFKIVYSLEPVPFFWNEEQNDIFKLNDKIENVEYEFVDNAGFKEIKTMTHKANNHKAVYRFSPAFPCISALKNNTEVTGKFTMGIDDIDGIVAGKYSVQKNGAISINFKPKECWQPMPGNAWVSAYKYHAKIKILSNDNYSIKSHWTIKK